MRRPTQPVWYSLVAVIVSLVITSSAGVWYTQRTAAESEHKWCDLLDALVGGPPPSTDRGRSVQEAMRRLHRDFGC